MTNPIVLEIDVTTGETIEREMTKKEFAQYLKDVKASEAVAQ